MACTTEKTTTLPVTLKQGIRGSKGRVVRNYYVQTKRCGKAGSYTFNTSIHRSSDDENIGTTSSTGQITLSNLDELEKSKQSEIKRQIRQALKKAKKFAIGNNITEKDRTKFLSNLGLNNTATDNKDTQLPVKKEEEKDPYQYTYSTIDIEIKGDRRKSYGNYYYPEDLSSNRQDRVRFTQKYSQGTKIEATIALYPKIGLREFVAITSDAIPRAGRRTM